MWKDWQIVFFAARNGIDIKNCQLLFSFQIYYRFKYSIEFESKWFIPFQVLNQVEEILLDQEYDPKDFIDYWWDEIPF